MAKYQSKLPKKEVEKIFYQLCLAISQTKKPKDAAELLRDLLSFQEAEMIAKRLKVAELLLDGLTYQEITEKLKVGNSTIARVYEWLKISGEGYRQAVKKTKNNKFVEIEDKPRDYRPGEWGMLKRRYPMYFWPEILLENIVKSANKRQKEQIKGVLKQLDKTKEKTGLYKKLKKMVDLK